MKAHLFFHKESWQRLNSSCALLLRVPRLRPLLSPEACRSAAATASLTIAASAGATASLTIAASAGAAMASLTIAASAGAIPS